MQLELMNGMETVQSVNAMVYIVSVGDFCLQLFLRDAKQAEVLLSQQDNFLSKEETPVRWSSLSDISFHSQFTSTLVLLAVVCCQHNTHLVATPCQLLVGATENQPWLRRLESDTHRHLRESLVLQRTLSGLNFFQCEKCVCRQVGDLECGNVQFRMASLLYCCSIPWRMPNI